LVVPPSSPRACDDWSYRVNWVNWINRVNGSDNTFFSVPDLSILAGNAFHSVVVGVRRASFNTLSFVVNRVSNALSAFTSSQHELSPADIEEVAQRVGN
jgi:hypothetical protein